MYMKRKNKIKKQGLVKQKFTVTDTYYKQEYPYTEKPKLIARDAILGTYSSSSIEQVIESITHKKQNNRGLKQMLADKEPNCVGVEDGMLCYESNEKPKSVMSWSIDSFQNPLYDNGIGIYKWRKQFTVRYHGHNWDFGYLTEQERHERYINLKKEIKNTSEPIVNGNVGIVWQIKQSTIPEYDNNGELIPQPKFIKVYKVKKREHEQMKTDYIKSNSKLAKWIHKRFVKYADQLGVPVPKYYINRRDIVERMGNYALSKTNDCTCIGRCWYSGIIWIDVNYHDLHWEKDQKEFKKNLDNTIAHEMVHLRFYRESDPLHVDHHGSKKKRAFEKRINQVMRGKRY